MKRHLLTTLLFLTLSLSAFAQPYRWIVPGTMSHRLDGSSFPQQEFTNLYRGHYYGYDRGGAMTGWGNSSQYEEFSLFEHPSDSGFISAASDVDTLAQKDWKRLMLNFRIAYPASFDSAVATEKYPLMLLMHGIGERGDCWKGRPSSCYSNDQDPRYFNNDHNISHGGRTHLSAINSDPSDPRHWPGFVVAPQNKNGWNPGSYVPRVISLLEELIKVYPIDLDRIYVHGYSNGADGAWMLINERPDMFAAAAAMSGFANNGAFSHDWVDMEETVVHLPIRQFQGGRDQKPRPKTTEQKMSQLEAIGGTPEYTLFPQLGHGTWTSAYIEPDFFSWFLDHSKLSIHSFYGKDTLNLDDTSGIKLGISPGFDAYEWQKMTLNDTVPVAGIINRPNEIIVYEAGAYRVRFARNNQWTEWSESYVIYGVNNTAATFNTEEISVASEINSETNEIFELHVYPNPTQSNNINLRGNIDSKSSSLTIQLVDMMGKSYYSSVVESSLINQGIRIEPGINLHSGMYIIQVIDNSGIQIQERLMIN